MNAKGIAKHLQAKVKDWLRNIPDDTLVKLIEDNVIITGGSLVSLLNNELPNDYDVYFKTKESCKSVAEYYANIWNVSHPNKSQVEIKEEDGRISAFIQSKGVVIEEGEKPIDDNTEPMDDFAVIEPETGENEDEQKAEKPQYRCRYFSTNAISLSDKIQLVIRFYGSVDDIHTNYDFVHCTCSYDYATNKVNLPPRALEAIINKELYYTGSKYPLCSIIRTRKFIERGWHINAGQYLKMALQLNELDLKDIKVFKDQLAGVDSAYFSQAIENIEDMKSKDPTFDVDNTYLFEVINRIF